MPKKTRETGNGTVISGTNGDDILFGLGGSYILKGGNGNDTYLVDDSGDQVDEKNNGGTDHVISYIDWTLGDNIENLTLEEGTDALAGTGNELDNEITGNSGANTLDGLGGNDTLDGGGGDDRLYGGTGDDTLIGGAGSDLIDGGSGSDTAIFAGPLGAYSFTWSGTDLHVSNGFGELDTLRNVEFLSFDDQVIAASDIGSGPEAVDDADAGAEDSEVIIPVLDNDLGQGISVASATNGSMGLVIVNEDGTVTYRPNENAYGTDTFSYTITDANGLTSTGEVTVELSAVNDAPVAEADSYAAVADEAFASIGSVLDNDTDVDGDTLRVSGSDATSSAGGTVQMNDDGMFTYTPPAGFTGTDSFTYTVADGNGGQATGTVTLDVAVAQDPDAPPYYVEALLAGDWYRLNANEPYGSSATVTFAFADATPEYYESSSFAWDNFQSFSAEQRATTRQVLEAIESFSGLTFAETSVENAEMVFGIADVGASGIAYWPTYDGTGKRASDVWIDDSRAGSDFIPGTTAYKTLIHEIGHAIGFTHPDLPVEEETRKFSVMAGNLHPTMGVQEPDTYMLYDIAALQYLYGANTDQVAGNDVYAFSAFDGAIKTIWDAGGHDIFDMSGATYSVELNLAGGAFSTVTANGSDNLAIAFGTVVEDAIGGAYDDRIMGNEANNRLTGGSGSDVFAFADSWGNDTVADFVRGDDLLDFGPAGMTFADLEITSSGGDTMIAFAGNSVTLEGVNSIDESDFLVVA